MKYYEAMKEDKLIELLREVKEALDEHGIEFWLGAGTLLGAVRNGKIIPWEHDIDLYTWDTNVSANVKRLVAKELSDKCFKVHIFEIPSPPHMHVHHREEDVWVDLNFLRSINDKAILPKSRSRRLVGPFLSYFSLALSNPYYYEVDFGPMPHITNFIRSILAKISRALSSSLRMRLTKIVTLIYEKIGSKDVSEVIPADYFRNLATMTFYGMEFKVPAEKEKYLTFRYGKDWRIPRRNWITNRDDGAVIKTKWRKRKRL